MYPPFRRRLLIAVLGWTATLASIAQGYQSRPIKMVVAYGAGGITDLLARQLAQRLSKRLGQPVVVENKPGGSSIPAAQYMASAAPDGYTLFLTLNLPYALNPSFFKSLPYDPQKAFSPIARIAQTPLGLQVASDSPFKTLQDLVRYARQNPGKSTHGSGGATSTSRLATELFKSGAGIDALHVPYTGGAALLTALVGQQIDWTLTDLSGSTAMIAAGKVRVLAVVADSRLPSLPQVPTLAEAGFPEVSIPPIWFGVVAPPQLPSELGTRLWAHIAKEMASPEMTAFIESHALAPYPGSAEQLRSSISADILAWGSVIRKLGLALEP